MEYETHPVDDESTHLFVRNLPALYGVQTLALGRDPEETLDLVVADWKTPRQGDIIARRYRVGERFRRTGHVVTVSARHLELEQSVNLTYLASPALADERAVEAFSRRARLLSQVPTARTARVLDAGRLVFGAPFVVLEQLSGWTFSEVLRMRGRLPLNEAVDLVLQACSAVQEAHEAGVHRVGPNMTNLVVTRELNGVPVVKTVLFGAESAALGDLSPGGPAWDDDIEDDSTLPYLSPEDVQSPREQDGERADVWSLGVVFFELYTGARAFSGESTVRLLTHIVAESPPELYALRPEAPAEVRDVLGRCLAKDPFQRYATLDDLATALGALSRSAAAPRSAAVPAPDGARLPRKPPPLPQSPVPSADGEKRASLGDRAVTLTLGVAIGVLVVAAVQVLAHPTPPGTGPRALPSVERP